MATTEKKWHKNFLKYMKKIIEHDNYKDLPIQKKADGEYAWIATAKSEIGQKRIDWCISKGQELGFIKNHEPYPGMFADVMLSIHPTKWKPCQICGKEMSLYYHYPNAIFLRALNTKFNSNYTECNHISEIWDDLVLNGNDETTIASFLINKGSLDSNLKTATKEKIIDALENACRKGNKKCLGPGTMSNFPDRFDGFHTYNRCCRSTQDKGRSKENLKTYNKDRRAYEYWSDGNIHAANQFMSSVYFKGTSADHIGPISLGFVHDPSYLQPMPGGENSSKRDRLQLVDIENIIKIEERTGVYPMSWYSKLIWEFIKSNYSIFPNKVPTLYRDALKQNMTNFMYILKTILENCQENGQNFLIDAFLNPNYECFKYSYKFNEDGQIIKKEPRHITARNQNEKSRYIRIAIKSVYDYNEKVNRNNKNNLSASENKKLLEICSMIESGLDVDKSKKAVIQLVEIIERRIISTL